MVSTVLRGEKQGSMDYGPMPHGVFTVPEIAAAGDTEEVLQARNIPYVAGRAFYRDSNAGLARQARGTAWRRQGAALRRGRGAEWLRGSFLRRRLSDGVSEKPR